MNTAAAIGRGQHRHFSCQSKQSSGWASTTAVSSRHYGDTSIGRRCPVRLSPDTPDPSTMCRHSGLALASENCVGRQSGGIHEMAHYTFLILSMPVKYRDPRLHDDTRFTLARGPRLSFDTRTHFGGHVFLWGYTLVTRCCRWGSVWDTCLIRV